MSATWPPHPADAVLGKHEGPLWDEFCENLRRAKDAERTPQPPIPFLWHWSEAQVSGAGCVERALRAGAAD